MGLLPTKDTLFGKSPAGYIFQKTILLNHFPFNKKSAWSGYKPKTALYTLYVVLVERLLITDVPSIVMAKSLSSTRNL
jgi:hypothetical protein